MSRSGCPQICHASKQLMQQRRTYEGNLRPAELNCGQMLNCAKSSAIRATYSVFNLDYMVRTVLMTAGRHIAVSAIVILKKITSNSHSGAVIRKTHHRQLYSAEHASVSRAEHSGKHMYAFTDRSDYLSHTFRHFLAARWIHTFAESNVHLATKKGVSNSAQR
jgi:hypothetical protein